MTWLLESNVELVVMESSGIYWKSPYAHPERAGGQQPGPSFRRERVHYDDITVHFNVLPETGI